MIDRDVEPCRLHRGEPADNCGCCRSERIADPAAEPERIHLTQPVKLPPCCADLDEPPCPQHVQSARVMRQGIRTHGRPVPAVGDSGKAKSVQPEETT